MGGCLSCWFFVPLEELDPGRRERALRAAARRAPWARPLGWCRFYRRPVLSERERCPAFRPLASPSDQEHNPRQ